MPVQWPPPQLEAVSLAGAATVGHSPEDLAAGKPAESARGVADAHQTMRGCDVIMTDRLRLLRQNTMRVNHLGKRAARHQNCSERYVKVLAVSPLFDFP